MPAGLQIEDAGSRILIWDVTESCDALLSQLTAINRDEYEQFGTEKRKKEYLAARLALKTLLGYEVCIQYTSDRKPYIADSENISITHSATKVGVMINKQHPVGIDIELFSPKIGQLFTRFMSEAEQSDFHHGADIRQLQIVWSAKEAMYKIIGHPAIDFANQLRVLPFSPATAGQIECIHLPENRKYTLNYRLEGDYTLVYCTNDISYESI